MDHMGIQIDPSRDELFDPLGITRLKESYMTDMRSHHRKGLPMYQKLSQAIQIMHNGCMIMLAIIGYLIALLFFLTVGLSVACLSLVILILSTIQQKVLSRIFLKQIGSLCSGGGVGIGFGIRSAGDKSTGVMPHLKMYDASSSGLSTRSYPSWIIRCLS